MMLLKFSDIQKPFNFIHVLKKLSPILRRKKDFMIDTFRTGKGKENF